MLSGQLVWSGDHFATVELAQLRGDRENKAMEWLDKTLKNESGETEAAVVVLVVPEEAFAPGVLYDLRRLPHIDPPLGYGDGPEGADAEGRYFTSNMRRGRAKVLRNGVVEGVAWLNAHVTGPNRIDLDPFHSNIEDNVSNYLKMQRTALNLSGRSWVTLSLTHADGLRADITSMRQQGKQALTQSSLPLPPLLVDTSVDDNQERYVAVRDTVSRLFAVLADAFGL